MDHTPSTSSSRRNHDEAGMEEVQSDMHALQRLYGFFSEASANENLDEASRAYMMRMLDDATEKTLLRQAKMISGSLVPPALGRNPSIIRSDRQMTSSGSLLVPPALERNPSVRSDRQNYAVERWQSLIPPASPGLSIRQVSERLHRLNVHQPSSSSRNGGLHIHDVHRRAGKEPVLSRLPSNRSSSTVLLLRSHPSPPSHGLSFYRLPVVSQQGTVTGGSKRADLQYRVHPSYGGRGDPLSLERRSSIQRSTSRRQEQPNDNAAARRMGPDDEEGSSSTHRLGRLGSGLSLGMTTTSLRGSERVGSGATANKQPRYSSSTSSKEVATIRSRIRPHGEVPEERRWLRRVAEEEGSTSSQHPWREYDAGVVGSRSGRKQPQRTLNRNRSDISAYSIGSSSATSVCSCEAYMSPTWSASTVSSYSSSPVSRRRGRAPLPLPAYASKASDLLRARHRRIQEVKARREGLLRKLAKKIGMVFHHRHDHHHHHQYQYQQHGNYEEPFLRGDRSAPNRRSPWKHLGGIFHREKTTNRHQTTVSVPKMRKRGGGGGGGLMHVLFGAVRHLHGKRKAKANIKMPSRVQVKKKAHWWQKQLKKRRGRPRRRLGR